ncbi:MAG: helix-turn-helix transcriptional regulator [Bacteroidota bacterium]|nr:helix-turn-helix transcriptional regulator [Bacteroidota bacterium]
MTKKKLILLPKTKRILVELGENLKLARLRRKYSSELVAERANISRPTLLSIEKGSQSVSIGAYLQVLMIMGLEKDLLLIAKDDELGRKLQDAKLLTKKRAPKRNKKT